MGPVQGTVGFPPNFNPPAAGLDFQKLNFGHRLRLSPAKNKTPDEEIGSTSPPPDTGGRRTLHRIVQTRCVPPGDEENHDTVILTVNDHKEGEKSLTEGDLIWMWVDIWTESHE